jgi:hypothetical protein
LPPFNEWKDAAASPQIIQCQLAESSSVVLVAGTLGEERHSTTESGHDEGEVPNMKTRSPGVITRRVKRLAGMRVDLSQKLLIPLT